ncbi:autotransporter outer membrane beta-barrel domain-containing protein [Bosea sp. 2RAB26]|uniref:autotransporter outer membrane beta-barrel domain-containing protein n=1 Tax=Bosea sp. 2RAB26 TaxID=3237476 RepID=UPI003F91B946
MPMPTPHLSAAGKRKECAYHNWPQRVSVLLSGAALLTLLAASPALAGGGAGGNGTAGTGGAGGTDNPTGAGTAGGGSSVAGTGTVSGGGGAGGGAGTTGGAGGKGASNLTGAGGAGGAAPGADGGNGSNGGTFGAGGGGGGAHGYVGGVLPAADTTGGKGGRGGDSTGGGGGGGAGGFGAVVTGNGLTGVLGNSAGGNGGDGGTGSSGKGSGGSGGIGIQFTGAASQVTLSGTARGGKGGSLASGAGGVAGDGGIGVVLGSGNELTVSGSVIGGNGGTLGTGTPAATGGAGGIGITGSNARLIITSAGSVTGGTGGSGVQANAITLSGGTNSLELQGPASAISGTVQGGSGNDTLILGGTSTATTFDMSTVGASAQFRSFESFSKTGPGTWTLTGTTTEATPWTVSGGTLSIASDGALGTPASPLSLAGGTLATTADVSTARLIFLGTGGGTLSPEAGTTLTLFGLVTGVNGLTKDGGGVLNVVGTISIGGTTTVNGGTLLAGRAGAFSATSATTINAGGTLDLGGFAQMINSVTLAGGTLTNGALTGAVSSSGGSISALGGTASVTVLSGRTTVTGSNGYTGATTVTGGSLIVNGSIAASSSVTIAAGALLGGSGQLPTTQVSGTLSPGNSPGTLTVNGDLTFNPGSTYIAEVQGAVADRISVTGTAALAGTLRIVPLGGAYSFDSPYTLLSAAGGRTGSFSPVDTTGSFGDGVTTAVSYTANDVRFTLTPNPLAPIVAPPAGPSRLGIAAPTNAFAIASAIDGAVANGANPSSLFGVYNQTAAAIPAAVNSLSGEIHTAPSAMANVASDQFLRAMLDPTAAGRLANAGAAGPGTAMFSGLNRKGADVSAAPSRLDMPLYSVWGAGFGSYGRTDGSAAAGSARRQVDDAHLATGIDIRPMPGTVAGLAVSGGRSRASLPGLLGNIDADVFQAGLYGVTQLGLVKLGAAASYARLDNDVSRSIPALGSALSSSYATTAWSGRLQASASVLSWNGFSLSPLAALQATRAHSPAVIEGNWAGANAGALALGKRNDVTSRSEAGVQLDADTVLGGVPVTGYIRAAWAHYFQRDADLTASLLGLPGASFAATGAQAERNSALVAAGITARISERVSLGLNLDGELSGNSRRLGGSAQLRVSF